MKPLFGHCAKTKIALTAEFHIPDIYDLTFFRWCSSSKSQIKIWAWKIILFFLRDFDMFKCNEWLIYWRGSQIFVLKKLLPPELESMETCLWPSLKKKKTQNGDLFLREENAWYLYDWIVKKTWIWMTLRLGSDQSTFLKGKCKRQYLGLLMYVDDQRLWPCSPLFHFFQSF